MSYPINYERHQPTHRHPPRVAAICKDVRAGKAKEARVYCACSELKTWVRYNRENGGASHLVAPILASQKIIGSKYEL